MGEPFRMSAAMFVELGADEAGRCMNQMRETAEEQTGQPHTWQQDGPRDAMVCLPASPDDRPPP